MMVYQRLLGAVTLGLASLVFGCQSPQQKTLPSLIAGTVTDTSQSQDTFSITISSAYGDDILIAREPLATQLAHSDLKGTYLIYEHIQNTFPLTIETDPYHILTFNGVPLSTYLKKKD